VLPDPQNSLIDLGRIPTAARMYPPLRKLIERLIGISQINTLFRDSDSEDKAVFIENIIARMELSLVFDGEENLVARSEEPAVIFGNHPLGLADQFLLAVLMHRHFKSYRMLGNMYMNFGQAFNDTIVRVDPFKLDSHRNRSATRDIIREFGVSYDALGLFPAGICSRHQQDTGLVSDSTWSEVFWKLAERKKARLIPIFFHGSNSQFFHFTARKMPGLSPALLPREFLRLRRGMLRVTIGRPITIEAVQQAELSQRRVSFLRASVYELRTDDRASPAAPPAMLSAKRTLPRPARTGPHPPLVVESRRYKVTILEGWNQVPLLENAYSFRKSRFVADIPSHTDYLAYHLILTVRDGIQTLAYLRVLDWQNIERDALKTFSPSLQSFEVDKKMMSGATRLLEVGRFCTSPTIGSAAAPLLLWRALAELAKRLGGRDGAIGVVTLVDLNPVLASVQFAYVQAHAASIELKAVRPKWPLLDAFQHHQWAPHTERLLDAPPRLDSLLRVYLAIGTRFGPAGRMQNLGDCPGILTHLSVDDLRNRTTWRAGLE
jgi:putative hemolysin